MVDTAASVAARYDAIDGLRAWLAGAVFVTHAVFLSGLQHTGPWSTLHELGGPAVQLFIIVSGFLIAGVVLSRRERWSAFMTRRVFRLYPLYLVGLALGALTMTPMADVMADLARTHAWAETPARYLTTISDSVTEHPWLHALLHLTMMHGVMPDSSLQYSALAINTPAWSLSLEWQFYLLAPLIVGGLASAKWRVITVLIAIVAYCAFRLLVFGGFAMTSHLASASHLFLIGIGTQLVIGRLRNVPLVIAFACLGLAFVYREFAAPLLWGAFVVVMLHQGDRRNGFDTFVRAAFATLLETPAARWFGLRSYGFYLLHWPVLGALLIVAPVETLSQGELFLVHLIAGFVLSIVLSHLAHILIELPCIEWGARLLRRQRKPALKPATLKASL